MKLSIVAVLAFSNVLPQAHADLPVHCVRHQVVGDWEFTLGPLGDKRTSCGHRKPDNPKEQPPMKFLEDQGELTKKKMSLQDPSTVSSEEDGSGTWTMIYDEGFEVAMNDMVFFAFSKFSFTDGPEGQNNISHCAETQIGWYHNAARSKWGCYVGKKLNPAAGDTVMPSKAEPAKSLVQQADEDSTADSTADNEDAKDTTTAVDTKAKQEEAQHQDALATFGSALDVDAPAVEDQAPKPQEPIALAATSTDLFASATDQDASAAVPVAAVSDQKEASTEDLFAEPAEYKPWVPTASAGFDKPMPSNFPESVANSLNFLQLGWVASAYDQFSGKSPRQLNKLAGTKRNRLHGQGPRKTDVDKSFISFLGMSSKHRHRRHKISASEGDELDWRNKDGTNFLEQVVTQGDCGSCYTISTLHMLTARNKIRANSISEPSFSVSFPLYCSEYNQGCDGGYGFLQSKWNEDVGLVPASCAPFSTGGGSCKVTANCDLGSKRYRAHNHHYIGGYYGGSDPETIRQELVEKGPLVMSFEPKEDFMYYKQGVYKSSPQKIHQEWEQVDHAVLLVGYGSEKSQQYWSLQNSWGSDWGEDGYFRMARGSDESGCESIAVSAEVIEEESNPTLDSFIAEL